MASAAQETLYRVFLEISGDLQQILDMDRPGGLSYLVVRQIHERATAAATAAVKKEDGGGGVTSVLESVFKNALGAVPLIRGIVSLFGGGGDSEAPPPLVKFALPAPVQFFAAETREGFSAADYDQTGMPRVIERTQAGMPVPQQQTAVTVNVQAMDARSFLDRSTEIAAAVREAMLNLNSINDVVNEL